MIPLSTQAQRRRVGPGLLDLSGRKRRTTGTGIAVDASGNAYVTGGTDFAPDFPTTPGAFQTTFGGMATPMRLSAS